MRHQVLFVDDNDDINFKQPFIELAFQKGNLELTWVKTWEEAKKNILANKGKYKALILDGKGQQDTTSKTEDDSFLDIARTWLRDRAVNGDYIPYVVYSGYAEELQKFFGSEDIFWKEKNEEVSLFEKLNEKIGQTELFRCKHLHPKPFEAIGGDYLPESCSDVLVKLIRWSEEPILTKIWFNSVRDLIEEVFKRANVIDNVAFVPDNQINTGQNGRPKLASICALWIGDHNTLSLPDLVVGDHIGYLLRPLVNLVQMMSHSQITGQNVDTVTIYSFRASVNSLMEILIWFKGYVDAKYP